MSGLDKIKEFNNNVQEAELQHSDEEVNNNLLEDELQQLNDRMNNNALEAELQELINRPKLENLTKKKLLRLLLLVG